MDITLKTLEMEMKLEGEKGRGAEEAEIHLESGTTAKRLSRSCYPELIEHCCRASALLVDGHYPRRSSEAMRREGRKRSDAEGDEISLEPRSTAKRYSRAILSEVDKTTLLSRLHCSKW
jgi:hypothetical protein